MKKIVSCIVLSLLLLSGTVFATPLTNFEKGKSAIDIGMTRPKLELGDNSNSAKLNKQTNIDFGITTGLSDKLALQYKYQKSDTPLDLISFIPAFDAKMHELNLLYSLDPNIYAFAGVQRLSYGIPFPGMPGEDKTVAQFGITGVAKLSDKFDGWATAAVGNDNYSYEVGVGYALSNEADLNLFYRYKRVKDLEFLGTSEFDVKIKGLGASVTVRF